MSVYLYDKALTEKLREVVGDDRIHVIPPEDTLFFLAQLTKDKVNFPAITITRGPVQLVTETRNQVAYRKGDSVRLNPDHTITKVKHFPMRIQWSINVYTVDRYSCDEIIRELVFYLMTYPSLEVQVPYGADIPQNFDLFIENEIEDNSDLSQFSETGEYFRETITVFTDNAHMFSTGKVYPTKPVIKKQIINSNEEVN